MKILYIVSITCLLLTTLPSSASFTIQKKDKQFNVNPEHLSLEEGITPSYKQRSYYAKIALDINKVLDSSEERINAKELEYIKFYVVSVYSFKNANLVEDKESEDSLSISEILLIYAKQNFATALIHENSFQPLFLNCNNCTLEEVKQGWSLFKSQNKELSTSEDIKLALSVPLNWLYRGKEVGEVIGNKSLPARASHKHSNKYELFSYTRQEDVRLNNLDVDAVYKLAKGEGANLTVVCECRDVDFIFDDFISYVTSVRKTYQEAIYDANLKCIVNSGSKDTEIFGSGPYVLQNCRVL